MSNCPGLVDFAIGLVNSVLDLPQRASEVFWGIQITEGLLNPYQNFGIVGVTFGPLHAQVSQAPQQEWNVIYFLTRDSVSRYRRPLRCLKKRHACIFRVSLLKLARLKSKNDVYPTNFLVCPTKTVTWSKKKNYLQFHLARRNSIAC